MNQVQLSPSALTALVAVGTWLATTLIILILAAIDRRRRKRAQRLVDALFAQAQTAVTRHQWARGAMGSRDDWIVFDRTMENLGDIVQRMEQEPAR
ncbi:MAG: hypothetical protein GWN58_25865 [Anaerolineae bacterium]|nr:hypothetical protein [Anaerolineae bacterium]